MLNTPAYAAFDSKSPLRAHTIQRRDPGPSDVHIEILHCGVCHSDLHQVRDEWQNATYPMVPGHEIVGKVVAVGAKVTKLAVGEIGAVGCMIGSCGTCDACKRGLEQYCAAFPTMTYNGKDKSGANTYGGYSSQIVVDEAFVLKVKAKEPLAQIAPLLCAGITTYSPLKHWKVGKGSRVGVVGLGGLGHMAVKLAVGLGAEVVVFSHSAKKKDDAKRLGAHEFVITTDDAAMQKQRGRLNVTLDAVSAPHDLVPLVGALTVDGTHVLLGVPDQPATVPAMPLILGRRAIAGSLIGGIAETQEMLDFCAAKGISSDVESIPVQEIDRAFDRMLKGDVRYRFVIDTKSLR